MLRRRQQEEEAKQKQVDTDTKIGQAISLAEQLRSQLTELRAVLDQIQETSA